MSRTLKLLDYTIPPVHIIDNVDYILFSDVAYWNCVLHGKLLDSIMI